MDPRTEIAVLKIDAQNLPHFNLDEAVAVDAGARVLAFSNLFGVAIGNEPASVLHGIVAAKTDLAARRGAFETNYRGQVYVLDAMTNNPGAAGGALTDRRGRLVGLLGKELRSSHEQHLAQLRHSDRRNRHRRRRDPRRQVPPRPRDEGEKKPKEAHSLALLGITSSPTSFPRRRRSSKASSPAPPPPKPASSTDDLVLFVNGRVVPSCKLLVDELTFIDRLDPVRLTMQRGQELLEVELIPAP